MVKVKDDPPMAESNPAPAPQSSNSTSNASSNYFPRKSRPHPHHHHHPPFQHFTHQYHHCSYPTDSVDASGSTNGAASPAKFYFGPGFEPQQQIPGGGYGPGPSQGQGNEYVVFFHVNPGVTISFQMGENLEILRGPVTVPMVSTNASPPIAMPVQVPPGHVVQQIVDESGTLRHVIISPQHPPNLLPLPTHNPQPYASGPGNSTNQSQQYYPGLPTGFPPQQFHSNLQTGHQVPAHLGHSPPPNPSYYKDERTQRQHIKLKKKLHEKQQKNDSLLPRKELLNGMKRSGLKDKGMNSVGTSEDGEESSVPDEEDYHVYITDILSSVQAPKVSELTSRSALLQWAPPARLSESASNDGHDIDVSESDLRYEVLLSDKSKEMKFKSIYSGPSLSCRIRDLKPGQEYSVCLQVHLDELQSSAIDLQGSATDPFKFVTPPCEPDQPQPPKLINRSKNSLQLKWTAGVDNGAPILHYVLEYDEGKGGDFVEFYRGRSRTHTLQKLQPATLYTFRLASVNEVGISQYSDCIAYNTTEVIPTQPNPPTLVEAGVQSLHLRWLKRPRDDEFVLQMNDDQTKYGFITIHLGPEDQHVRQGLMHSSSYSFRLRAKNDGGMSPWSDEVSFCTLPDKPSRPSKPVVKGRIHAHSFKLKWDPPNDTGGVDILRYILEVNSGSGYKIVYQGKETEAICDKLTPGTTYQLRVSCVSVGGCSNASDPCTVTTDAVCPGQCSLPKLVGKPLPNSVSLRWVRVEPDYNGGAPVLDYEVEMTSGTTQSIAYKSKENECTVNNLSPGCDYTFRVRAVNRVGPGQWSDSLKVTSGAAPPSAPSIPSLQCKTPFHVYVEWLEPQSNGAPVNEYRLEMSPDVNEEKFLSVYQGPQLNYDVKGLTAFHSYYFRVQAGNAAGFSNFSPVAGTITPAAPPMAVATLKSESTPSSITLHWNPPSDNGSPITHYNIELGDKTFATEAPVVEYTIENLQPATNYKIKIQAVNLVGPGPYSSSLRTATLRLPPVAPRLECIAVGHNHLKLKWGEGKNTEYTQYCIEMENPRSREYQCVYKGTALTCKVNRLDELTTYKFRINAKNDAGVGEYSQVYEFATCIAPPAAVKLPKVADVEQRSCTMYWFPVKNAFSDAVVYQVQVARLKEQVFKQVYESSDPKCTIENLEPGTDYTARVCPIRITSTGVLPGPYSSPVNFTTTSSEPDALAKAAPSSSSLPHAPKHRSLYHSIRQMVKCPEEYCIYMYALLVLILGIVISLGITSFL